MGSYSGVKSPAMGDDGADGFAETSRWTPVFAAQAGEQASR